MGPEDGLVCPAENRTLNRRLHSPSLVTIMTELSRLTHIKLSVNSNMLLRFSIFTSVIKSGLLSNKLIP
jgi:hypothetical protein